ncbi:MAG: DUF1641 domain-containing protein [Alphaproteobacteria bacterium]|nr:DUF1641 domain-containing protein [Alphaproteobacteria bacterium]
MHEDEATNLRILALLESLDQRMTTLERRLDGLAPLAAHGPAAVAMVTDAVDHHVAQAQASGVDVDARMAAGLRLVERLTRPEVAAQLEQALDLAAQLPAAVAMAADTLDGVLGGLVDRGVDLDERVRMLNQAAEALTRPAMLELVNAILERGEDIERVLRALLESGVLEAQAVEVVGHAGEALATTRAQEVTPLGPFALLRALSDRDVGRAVAFGVHFARRFGTILAQPTP